MCHVSTKARAEQPGSKPGREQTHMGGKEAEETALTSAPTSQLTLKTRREKIPKVASVSKKYRKIKSASANQSLELKTCPMIMTRG